MRVSIRVSSPIAESFRVAQVRGLFDLARTDTSEETFAGELPDLSDDGDTGPWRIGAIVGPSGSGKSTLARAAYGDRVYAGGRWPRGKAVIDGFPARYQDLRPIAGMLNAVGFSSPPAWLRPYHVLSGGERFRCDLARALLSPLSRSGRGAGGEGSPLVVFDEFTSVVDRTVAQIGSAAVAKAIRRDASLPRFVAVTCHYDVLAWLEPDWWLDLATGDLSRRALRRPRLELQVVPVHRRAWELFRRHHYLSHAQAACVRAWAAFLGERPVAYSAWLFRHRDSWREHRTVVLPDFQGLGIGNRLSEWCAALVRGRGYRAYSTTSHPAMIRHRAESPLWRLFRHGQKFKPLPGERGSLGRVTAGFEFLGPPLAADLAERLW